MQTPQRLQWQAPAATVRRQPAFSRTPRLVDKATVRANFQQLNSSQRLQTGSYDDRSIAARLSHDPFGDSDNKGQRTREFRPANNDPFADPFGDARSANAGQHRSRSPFQQASYDTSMALEHRSELQPLVPVKLPPVNSRFTRARKDQGTLLVQGPRLAQSEEPSLDDLQLYDDDDFPIPTEPSETRTPSGAYDFQPPDANPFGDDADVPDAPGDFQERPGTFPDAPEPKDIRPNDIDSQTLPEIDVQSDLLLPDVTDHPDPLQPDTLPHDPKSPSGNTDDPRAPDSDFPEPASTDPSELTPIIPGVESPIQPEIDELDFPDTMPDEPATLEPTDETPELQPDVAPDLTEPQMDDPQPFEPQDDPQTLPDPYPDETPSLAEPEPEPEPDTFDPERRRDDLDQDRDELQRELDELEERLGTPEREGGDDVTPRKQDRPKSDGRDAFAVDEDDEEDEDKELECDRNYNERNCCENDEECRTAWERLTSRRVMDIGLDITPPFAPLSEDADDAQLDQQNRLAEAPSRTWRDRHGTAIASGTLRDFRDGYVFVNSIDGRTASIPFQRLSHDDLCFVTAWWGLPNECTVMANDDGIRDWRLCTFTWKASALCHKPFYFEDAQLERYGHSAGPILQPLVTTAHFFSNVLLVPYNMGVYPPNECRYALGHYRPGNCAPWLVPAFPLSERGAKAELITLLVLWGFAA